MTVAGIVELSIAIGDSCHSLNRQVEKKLHSLHQKHYFGSMIEYSFIKDDNKTQRKQISVRPQDSSWVLLEISMKLLILCFSFRTGNKLRAYSKILKCLNLVLCLYWIKRYFGNPRVFRSSRNVMILWKCSWPDTAGHRSCFGSGLCGSH